MLGSWARLKILIPCLVTFFVYGCFLLTKTNHTSTESDFALSIVPPPYFASRFPNTANNYEPLSTIEQFFDYLDNPILPCADLRQVGGVLHKKVNAMDGQKDVCYDPTFGVTNGGDCIVLSFGINNEWSFDDAIGRTGCQVYAFDPSMAAGDHKRSDSVTFFHLGISNFNGILDKAKKKMNVETYSTILERLHLTSSTIAYLKMDVEGSELDFFSDVFKSTPDLLKNVQQIGMEIHPGRYKGTGLNPVGKFESFWNYFQDLEHFGFDLISANKNEIPNNPYEYKNVRRSQCYEVLWGRRN